VAWKIALGAVACLVLVVGVAVTMKLARRAPAPPAAPVASAAAVVPAPEATSVVLEPLPPAVDLFSSEAATASESAADEALPPDVLTIPPHDHRHGLLVIACTPSCDSVFVDGHPIAHAERGTLLDPGVHTVGANLANHPGKTQSVVLHQGRVRNLHIAF
jgi:hypothetical protein